MSDRSLVYFFAAGLRVASSDYTPAHSKMEGGVRKNVSAKLVVNAYHNLPGKANDGKGKNEVLSYTFWGGLADIAAKTLSSGKEFDVMAQPNVYQGTVYVPGADGKSTGVPAQWANGQVIKSKKVSFTVQDFKLGQDGAKLIQKELSAIPPKRPADWNVQGSAGHAAFAAMQKERMKLQYKPGFTEFGYARVVAPTGQDVGAYVPKATATTAAAGPVNASIPAAFPQATVPMGAIPAVQTTPQTGALSMINAAGGF